MEKLKPCPFCGSIAVYHRDEQGIDIEDMVVAPNVMHFVWCDECRAVMSADSEEKVIKAWNRRAITIDDIMTPICEDYCKHLGDYKDPDDLYNNVCCDCELEQKMLKLLHED